MTYDPKCYELAQYFLEDVDALVVATDLPRVADVLAQEIQLVIESFIHELKDDLAERAAKRPMSERVSRHMLNAIWNQAKTTTQR